MQVHGNVTEHMYEDVYKGIITRSGTAYTNPNLYTQEIMSDFYGSIQEATKSGIVQGEKITQGNQEFIFARLRQAGQLPVIKHAQFNGWHQDVEEYERYIRDGIGRIYCFEDYI